MDLPGTRLLNVEERLARWVPDRPRTDVGRIAAAAWAAPATLLGFCVASAAGGHRRWEPTIGVWLVEDGTGPVADAQRALGWIANTIGYVVIGRDGSLPPRTLAHESVHVRQHERFGPLLLPVYLWYLVRRGYRDHPLERAARRAASRAGP